MKKKRTGSSHPDKVKHTARNKIRRIEKEMIRLEPLASARGAVEKLKERLEYWKKLL